MIVNTQSTQEKAEPIVVIGIGNVLCADEGFGVRCVEALRARYTFAPQPSLIDGGTQGLYLLPHVQSATRLIVFDAVDYGLPGGTLHCVRDADVPRYLGAKKLSLHQTGFQEVLALAELSGSYPRQVLLIGCQPALIEAHGGSLSPPLRAAIEPALARAVLELTRWGVSSQLAERRSRDYIALGASANGLQLVDQPTLRCDERGHA